MMNALEVRGRQHVRAAVHGGADITVDGKRMVGPYLIENLSVGGALLIGSSAPAVNTIVDVELRPSGLQPIRVAGVVARLYEAATEHLGEVLHASESAAASRSNSSTLSRTTARWCA